VRVLLDQLQTQADRDWYAARAVEEGWKRSVLEHFIKVGLKAQLGAAPTNFKAVLDAPDSELAQQLVKDPYVFEHLAYVERADERNVEQALMDRIQDTLMEFGRGMAFVGILLCTGKNESVVRFTLANMATALGVADYEGLPADVKAAVPSPGELQAAVADQG